MLQMWTLRSLCQGSCLPSKRTSMQEVQRRDHFAKMCKSKGNDKKTVKCVETENQDRDYAFVMRDCSNTARVTFNVGGVDLLMLTDSGASSNIVDEDTWEMLKSKRIKCTSTVPPHLQNAYTSKRCVQVPNKHRKT